ncbi:hypothetical protein VTK73DRAFT_8447 [Phialemonium thermophilum]|uniref:Uncharacterized protein n=1 Tax=Phialemonium thermophilum TaxID=223376 RepID=A0ABR3XNW6_9PEZI
MTSFLLELCKTFGGCLSWEQVEKVGGVITKLTLIKGTRSSLPDGIRTSRSSVNRGPIGEAFRSRNHYILGSLQSALLYESLVYNTRHPQKR